MFDVAFVAGDHFEVSEVDAAVHNGEREGVVNKRFVVGVGGVDSEHLGQNLLHELHDGVFVELAVEHQECTGKEDVVASHFDFEAGVQLLHEALHAQPLGTAEPHGHDAAVPVAFSGFDLHSPLAAVEVHQRPQLFDLGFAVDLAFLADVRQQPFDVQNQLLVQSRDFA